MTDRYQPVSDRTAVCLIPSIRTTVPCFGSNTRRQSRQNLTDPFLTTRLPALAFEPLVNRTARRQHSLPGVETEVVWRRKGELSFSFLTRPGGTNASTNPLFNLLHDLCSELSFAHYFYAQSKLLIPKCPVRIKDLVPVCYLWRTFFLLHFCLFFGLLSWL